MYLKKRMEDLIPNRGSAIIYSTGVQRIIASGENTSPGTNPHGGVWACTIRFEIRNISPIRPCRSSFEAYGLLFPSTHGAGSSHAETARMRRAKAHLAWDWLCKLISSGIMAFWAVRHDACHSIYPVLSQMLGKPEGRHG